MLTARKSTPCPRCPLWVCDCLYHFKVHPFSISLCAQLVEDDFLTLRGLPEMKDLSGHLPYNCSSVPTQGSFPCFFYFPSSFLRVFLSSGSFPLCTSSAVSFNIFLLHSFRRTWPYVLLVFAVALLGHVIDDRSVLPSALPLSV